jgi:hypothetical protein
MPAIERLVQQLRAVVALAGDHHPARVQIVLRGGCRFLASKLDQGMTQLGCRQAGPDDRTVQVGGKVPNSPPARRRGGDAPLRLSRDLPLAELPQEVTAAQGIELWDEKRRSPQQGPVRELIQRDGMRHGHARCS